MSKQDDRKVAKSAAYKSEANPFLEGTRLHRYFTKARQHVENMDAAFRDFEQVYGTIGMRRSSSVSKEAS